jgi:hypothetical protein
MVRHYFYVHSADEFHNLLQPALVASWQDQGFSPCQDLCSQLLSRVRSGREFYEPAEDAPLLSAVSRGVGFTRSRWKLLVHELLFYGACDMPLLESSCETLCRLLGPAHPSQERHQFVPIQRVHFGTRDLRFGGGYYRPDHAGFNEVADVRFLSDYLDGINPQTWDSCGLAGLEGFEDEEALQEELQLAREWFPGLCELYRSAATKDQIVICETL